MASKQQVRSANLSSPSYQQQQSPYGSQKGYGGPASIGKSPRAPATPYATAVASPMVKSEPRSVGPPPSAQAPRSVAPAVRPDDELAATADDNLEQLSPLELCQLAKETKLDLLQKLNILFSIQAQQQKQQPRLRQSAAEELKPHQKQMELLYHRIAAIFAQLDARERELLTPDEINSFNYLSYLTQNQKEGEEDSELCALRRRKAAVLKQETTLRTGLSDAANDLRKIQWDMRFSQEP